MADYGTKFSRAGYPVETAADHQLLFSSSFPTLITYLTGTLTSGAQVTHGLNYYPVFWYQVYGTVSGTSGNTDYTQFEGANITVDTSNLYNNSSHTIRYSIFPRSLRTNLSGTNIVTTPAVQTTVSQDFGFKISEPGYPVESAGLANLIAFSGLSLANQPVRQNIIHSSGFQDNVSDSQTVNYAHGLGYASMFLAYRKFAGGSQYYLWATHYVVNGDQSLTIQYQVTINSSNLSILLNGWGNQDIAYVILKDPFDG